MALSDVAIMRRGEECPWAVLTEEAVLDIRRRVMSREQYAQMYGCSIHSVRDVQRGRTWRHLLPGASLEPGHLDGGTRDLILSYTMSRKELVEVTGLSFWTIRDVRRGR